MLNPRRTPPPPVPVNFARVMRVGTLAWAVALVVTVVLAATGSIDWTAAWVCGVGIVLGLLGARWARRHPPTVPTSDAAAQTSTAPETAAE
ncbi:DUF2530 domain-containing protein [Cellulomonas sp. McL0617]|uniref:DUF2530 domain-containing protein n=1 Tax=Cellulomonas sp. McL0617 TaxID=3415675 RepID=UPI003CF0218C